MPYFDKIIDGENVLLFSYGLKNSSKTHIILKSFAKLSAPLKFKWLRNPLVLVKI